MWIAEYPMSCFLHSVTEQNRLTRKCYQCITKGKVEEENNKNSDSKCKSWSWNSPLAVISNNYDYDSNNDIKSLFTIGK